MTFQWSNFLDVSKHLIETTPGSSDEEDAFLRSAASRAYYAAYKTSNDWLEVNCPTFALPAGADSHKYLISYLKTHISDPKASFFIASWLEQLKATRKNADYEHSSVNNVWSKERAEFAHKHAQKICDKLKTCTPK